MIQKGQFAGARVLVVGDVMLDRYWFGDVGRVSPEAPVPVLAVTSAEERVGGAGNVALNVVSLGGRCRLVSVIGDDPAGERLQALIQEGGVTADLLRDDSVETTVKLRMIARNQQLLRADFETHPREEILEQCLKRFDASLADADVVVLSDYGKGGLQHVETMIERATAAGTPVVVDPKGADFSRYRSATTVTPNMREFEAVAGECDDENDFRRRGLELRAELDLNSLLVTRSDRGMCLFTRDGETIDSPARARSVYDVSGAGDTVIAAVALGEALGMPPKERLLFANTAAGLVVSKVGTVTAAEDAVIAALQKD